MLTETIGWVGNILFAICGIPQVIKTYKSKSAKDLSIIFLWLWFWGELLTGIYIVNSDIINGISHFPLYFNYFINILMACFLIYAKYYYPIKYPIKK